MLSHFTKAQAAGRQEENSVGIMGACRGEQDFGICYYTGGDTGRKETEEDRKGEKGERRAELKVCGK